MTQPESRTVEERLAAALWDAFSSKPHAEHVPGDCSTCDAYRELANQDAGLILAAAKEHGLVIGEGELDVAWKEVKAALPEGWRIEHFVHSMEGDITALREGDWIITVSGRSPAGYREEMMDERGPTPAAALHALAERLRR